MKSTFPTDDIVARYHALLDTDAAESERRMQLATLFSEPYVQEQLRALFEAEDGVTLDEAVAFAMATIYHMGLTQRHSPFTVVPGGKAKVLQFPQRAS